MIKNLNNKDYKLNQTFDILVYLAGFVTLC